MSRIKICDLYPCDGVWINKKTKKSYEIITYNELCTTNAHDGDGVVRYVSSDNVCGTVYNRDRKYTIRL